MKETMRQLVHLVFGVAIAFLILLVEKETVIVIFVASIFGGAIITDAVTRGFSIPLVTPLLDLMEREGTVPGKGAIFFAVSALFCLIFFPTFTVFIAILALSILDSITTMAGRRFGRRRIVNSKTAEGTGAGILVTAAVLFFLVSPAAAIVVAVIAGIVELISPIDDNLTIPVCVCLALTLLPGI